MTPRRTARLGALLAAAVAAVALGVAPAQARQAAAADPRTPATGSLPAPLSSSGSSSTAAEQVTQYWTAEAMADATPAPIPTDYTEAAPEPPTAVTETADGAAPAAVAPASAVETYALTHFSASKVWASHGAMPASSIGRLYYTDTGGARHYCSATVINSANHSTVWTAGHCISTGSGKWYSKFLFAPDFHGGSSPYGTWAGKSWSVPSGYHNGKSHTYDMGAIALSTNSAGKKVGDVVGWQGYKFGDAYSETTFTDVRSFGYPQNTHPARSGISTAGNDLRFCVGNATPVALYLEIGCDMGSGSSGGPWIYSMPLSRGWGYLIGDNSHHPSAGIATERSPQLGQAAINVRAAVQAD
ncbi:trypsin-like serine peptidase [Actinomadura parmotrematis]|uniref:Peptidase n=1 Tax=Actinomadura parmotrematis TaxID=2864039 RepID=A0ABS7FS63_9ACTN|nr:hypothetical protein [Actinomadura parmotrematis]MBW8483243.1 hypothetical protein [Actinomadura parmotrematis]